MYYIILKKESIISRKLQIPPRKERRLSQSYI